ncbi:iron-sulfur cluster-binding protein/coenzyme F420-reducing hydrogenase beta subunit putative [Prevotella sp. CAG:255]|uniref:4Fe-4S dicluster domain-containing protein n=1 Tax=Prevotella sp. CAG:255 TaxID=1262923 RepID=UPI00033848D6|nr:Coenzyme F420 hydrogenase/dehydrogenase, beta subunit C-terminal domain [Prevotella sp. CAG:255]CCX68132.1 iron-sulfur cluster-binding protein/coenzyme F420-reducing hydrogenase beta subunit putative [Prevotella sp. CAG:255]
MLEYNEKTNRIVYDYSWCQQCGICEAVCPKQAISMELRKDGTNQIMVDNDKCIRCKRCVNICPANKRENYEGYFDKFAGKEYYLGYNTDATVRHECSSGGVCKTIIIESLRNGLADGVYTLRRTDVFPYAEGEFYTKGNIPSYNDIPNSVYHSVMACRNISKIQHCKRLIVVGTSCQLRAMNAALKGKADEIIRICIFCKQQKTLDSTRFLAKIIGTEIPKNLKFSARYRGNGWPGIVRVNESELPWNRAAQIPFGRRLWTVPGCDICGDSFGIKAEADLTLMDPWKIRTPNNLGETLVTVHTETGGKLLKNIDAIGLQKKTFEDVKAALSLKDVWRKQQTEPFFRGEKCSENIKKAGEAELRQRLAIRKIVDTLPRMPILFYRVVCKFYPDKRNRILK